MMMVSQLLSQRQGEVLTCRSDMAVSEAARILAERRIGALPVMDGDKVVGIFSERDLLYNIASHGAGTLDRTVGKTMTSPAITIDAETDVMEALSLMTRRRVRHLPVVEGGAMVGFLSIGDLVKHRVEVAEAEAESLRNYIQTA